MRAFPNPGHVHLPLAAQDFTGSRFAHLTSSMRREPPFMHPFDEPASNADNTVLQCLWEPTHSFKERGENMASSGELIRMMNYVDDISTTLRRIVTGASFISPEERKKLAEYMRNSDPNFTKMVDELGK
jgi:hypothetical protein